MIEATWIAFAFVMGLGARAIGLPPLVGYLAAGFALAGFGDHIGVGPRDSVALEHIAHLGVLLLLFTVGLKLKLGNLARREVIGGGLLHFTISSLIFLPAIMLILDLAWQQGLLLAIALSFSSTVLAAKVLEGKRELRAFHGRVAIGVLIIQDLIALVVMSLASGKIPSAWALLLFGLPLLRPLLFRLLDASGHEELMVLLGLLLALVVGGHGFEQLGLSSELGALAFGAMLAKHKRATELSNSLWGIKEVFLVGFFLQIGIGGLPDGEALLFAIVMAVLLPLKGMLFFFLFMLFRLRARSAFLTGVSLTNYSEFGLIMASVVLPEWMIPLAITVALSFVISAPLNRIAHPLYERLAKRLIPLERNIRHPDEQPVSLGDAQVLVMGMGRTGRAAYDYLQEKGYQTGFFGKWHMGGQRDVGEAPLITEYGFDESLTNFEGMGPKLLPLTLKPGDTQPGRIWGDAEHLGKPFTWMPRIPLPTCSQRPRSSMQNCASSSAPLPASPRRTLPFAWRTMRCTPGRSGWSGCCC